MLSMVSSCLPDDDASAQKWPMVARRSHPSVHASAYPESRQETMRNAHRIPTSCGSCAKAFALNDTGNGNEVLPTHQRLRLSARIRTVLRHGCQRVMLQVVCRGTVAQGQSRG